ncbi:MAG: flagellar hook-length control protein FliK [Desulfarculus sp.]|nr:flagellar hook-length control protein FliK [Desulfarculus sp.]
MLDLIRARSIGAGQEKGPAREDSLAGLGPGRVVKAEVAGQEAGGLYRLRLMGQDLVAESQVPLKTGQRLNLTVVATKPQLVLSLGAQAAAERARAGQNALGAALQALLLGRQRLGGDLATLLRHDPQKTPPPTPQAGQAMASVRELAQGLVLDQAAAGDPQYLKRLLSDAGMDLEARLARLAADGGRGKPPDSLRTLLPGLTRSLAPELALLTVSDPERAAALREFLLAAQNLGEHFAANQRLNAELLPRQALIFLGLPMLLGDQLRQGELLLGLPQDQGDQEGQGASLVFFLELTALGALTVEARLHGAALSGRFLVEDAQRAEFLEEMLPELGERLERLGLQASFGVAVRPGPEQEHSSPLAQLLRQRGHYLSLTV